MPKYDGTFPNDKFAIGATRPIARAFGECMERTRRTYFDALRAGDVYAAITYRLTYYDMKAQFEAFQGVRLHRR